MNADEAAAERRKARTFKKFSYRGVEVRPTRTALSTPADTGVGPRVQLAQLLDLDSAAFTELVHARARRRFQRGLKRKPLALMKKLRKAKTEAQPNEKPAVVKTHLRDMIIVPEMIGSVVGIYNGKVFSAFTALSFS